MRSKHLAFGLLALALPVALGGCGDEAADTSKVQTISTGDLQTGITDYGNGVYYFDFTKSAFGNALSKFIGEHPELEVTAIGVNGTGYHGTVLGYFVSTQKRELQ